MISSKKFKFENLDSIRTIAFFSTFLAHAFYAESSDVLNSPTFQFAVHFREVFSFGVPIFFVLSGFLISYLMLKEQEEIGRFSLKSFYMRRVLRIWPVYFIVLIVGFVLFPLLRTYVLHDGYIETANSLYYLTFLSNFDQISQTELPVGVGLGPTWSVSIEEQFYVFWPLLLLFFKRRYFIVPIVTVIVASILLTSIYGLSNKHTIFCMTYLAVGGVFAYLSYYYKSLIHKITSVHSIVFLLSVAVLFYLIYLTTIGYGSILIIFAIASIIGYIIVYQCYAGKMQLKKIPFLEKWGKYTYGLYLYHVICNFIIHILIDDVFGVPENNWTALLVRPLLSLALSLIVSYLSYSYVEIFFLKLKKYFIPSKFEA